MVILWSSAVEDDYHRLHLMDITGNGGGQVPPDDNDEDNGYFDGDETNEDVGNANNEDFDYDTHLSSLDGCW